MLWPAHAQGGVGWDRSSRCERRPRCRYCLIQVRGGMDDSGFPLIPEDVGAWVTVDAHPSAEVTDVGHP